MYDQIITEGLREKDLSGMVSEVFTVDRYKSKMGEDSDIIVLGFQVREKYPAIDLMEFIEKGYSFILDADISAGEEQDGKYHVFVEMERTKDLPYQLKELFRGVGQLTDCQNWRFRYQAAPTSVEFTTENVSKQIPLSAVEYKNYMMERKQTDLKEFFDQGSVELAVDDQNNIKFTKPFSGDINARFISIGEYDHVKDTLPGALDLSENSHGEVMFLTKFLGNYDINKIGNKFLIRNGNKAVVIEKDKW